MSESITDLLREEAVIIEAEGATGESVDLLIDAADEITTLRQQLAESEARVAELEGFDFDGWYDKHQSLFREGAGKSDLRAAYKQGYRDSHPQPAQQGSTHAPTDDRVQRAMQMPLKELATKFIEATDRASRNMDALKSAQQGSVPKGENDFGLDARYFHEKLRLILRGINSYTPTEMARALGRLAITANPETMREPEFNISDLIDQPKYRDATPQPQADGWRKEIEAILADYESYQWATVDGVCEGCGNWNPNGHPEAHGHGEDCPELEEYERRRDWKNRLKALLYTHPQPAQQGADASLRVSVNSLIESARCLATSDSQASVDHWSEKVGFYRDRIYSIAQQESVPDYVNEALQRLIENGGNLGPASREDALVVARYRRELLATLQPEGDGRLQRLTGRPKTTR